MALSTQSVKNLKGGMSQQPDILRFPNQGGDQKNGWSSESQGLQKRPPSVFIKRIMERFALGSAPLFHLVNRDSREQYFMAFSGSGVVVFDLKGNNYEVRGYDGYANSTEPREDIRLLTVADYTFVVNRTQTVLEDTTKTHPDYPQTNRRAIVAVRGGQYGRTLEVIINGVVEATMTMPAGIGPSENPEDPNSIQNQVKQTDAQYIAKELAKQLTTKGYTATEGPGHVLIVSPHDIVTLTTKDGYGDQLINGFVYQVQSFNKLPAQAPDGYLVEITGEATRTGDNYWVRYSESGKVWKESVAPGIITGLNKHSMPRALVRAADGNFDWKVLDWDTRKAGDDETNPMPSIVGATINDVFFFRNRLGFLSGENVVMSRTARYFNFFPPSVASLSDDDPLDVAVSHNRVSILRYAVPFSEQLLLWSDQAQFVLSSSGILSPKSVMLDLTTEFDVQETARPFGIGRGVYFTAPRAAFTSLKRYYAVADVSDVKNAEDVSAHVPSFITNKVFNIHGSGTENYVTLLSDGSESTLFVYKFLYMDENIAQQSWGHWTFGKEVKILAAASIGSYMHLVLERPEGIMMERIEFTQFTKDFDHEPYRTYMDCKMPIQMQRHDPDEYKTFLNVASVWGGVPGNDEVIQLVDPRGVLTEFKAPEGGWTTSTELELYGNRMDELFHIGKSFEFLYEFSKFLIKSVGDDGAVVTEDSGRLQLRKAWVNYEQSGAFTVTVDNGSRQFSYVMAGGRLGGGIRLGTLSLGTGQFRFPVSGNALRQKVTMTSSVPTPLNVIGCGFEGNYARRSSGI